LRLGVFALDFSVKSRGGEYNAETRRRGDAETQRRRGAWMKGRGGQRKLDVSICGSRCHARKLIE
jgi:hypothetical protein